MDGPGAILPTLYGLGQATPRETDEETALRAFDAYFIGEMLKRSAPQGSTGLFDGGQAGRMYRDHFYQELARIIAENSDFGVSSTLAGSLDSTVEPPSSEEQR